MDFVLENDQRQIVGVEVKAAATVIKKDLAGLRKLQSVAEQSFICGVVLYDGDKILPFGERLSIGCLQTTRRLCGDLVALR